MKIATWNVNSINTRLPHLLKWLGDAKPDIVGIQETKTIDEKFPKLELEDLGYNVIFNGQKSYNGVALLSKKPIDEYSFILPNNPIAEQARVVQAEISGHLILNLYIPNGSEVGSEKWDIKLNFLAALKQHLQVLQQQYSQIIVMADYNIAPEPIDVYAPKQMDGGICYHPTERKFFRQLLNMGFVDSFRLKHPTKQQFSWWDYRAGAWQYNKGMRIDHLLCNAALADKIIDVQVDTTPRGWEKPSDHAPVILELAA